MWDWYFLATGYSWASDRDLWLPARDQQWSVTPVERRRILQSVFPKLTKQLSSGSPGAKETCAKLKNWIMENFTAEDGPLLTVFWQQLFMEDVGRLRTRYIQPLKRAADWLRVLGMLKTCQALNKIMNTDCRTDSEG